MLTDTALYSLASTAGLAVSWTDAFGHPQQVKPDTLRNILQALGLPCTGDQQCIASQQALEREQVQVTLAPLMTADVGSAIALPGRGLHSLHGSRYQIVQESGEVIEGRFATDTSLPLNTVAMQQAGYHTLYIGQHELTLAVAPVRCFGMEHLSMPHKTKAWAPSVQIYSLRDEGDAGLGTYTALAKLAQHAGRAGASALAISPVHAMFTADASRYSPYGPSNRAMLSAHYIDPAAISGQQAWQQAMQAIPGSQALGCQLETQALIDWQASTQLRLQLLRQLFNKFKQHSGAEQQAFAAFRQQAGTLLQLHAVYEALHADIRERNGSDDWRLWPAEYQHPDNAGVQHFARQHADAVDFHAFLQWQAALGLQGAQQAGRDAGMVIGLIYDMAVGADPKGSQAWMRREQFLQGLSVGAPPDLFFREGQAWGINALSTQGLRQHGYQAYIEMLRTAFQYAGGVRIDHVLGLMRLWLVPEGGSAHDGAYLHYPTNDLIRLISLESHRHRAIVIGEDLGTLPEGSRQRFSQAGILGMNVLWFQREGDVFMPPGSWNDTSIATSGTHDMASIAGWWSGRDIAIQGLSAEQSLSALAQRQQDKQHLLAALLLAFSAAIETDASETEQSKTEQSEAVQSEMEQTAGTSHHILYRALKQVDVADTSADATACIIDAILTFIAQVKTPLSIISMEDLLGIVDQPNLPGTVDSQPNWRRRLPDSVDVMLSQKEIQQRFAILNQAIFRQ